MDNNQMEQYITFIGENFYQHIQEQYGKNVEKILKFHDIDNYLILGQVNKQELLEIFEKPNDENSTNELIDLKKEVCSTFQEKITLKIGTKNKMLLLLKSAQDITKKRKHQLAAQARLSRLDKHRSTSSPANISQSDSEMNSNVYGLLIEESIAKFLTNMKNYIHGATYVNISAKDFDVVVEDIDNQATPMCFVECICGDRIKLFFNHGRFQISNLIKHLKNTNNRLKLLMDNKNKEIDDRQLLDEMEIDEEFSRNENNLSITQSTLNTNVNIDMENTDNTAPVTIKKSYSQKEKSRNELDDNHNGLSAKTTTITTNRKDSQQLPHILATHGETQSSISYTPSSNPKQQLINNEQRQTENTPSNDRYSKSVKEQNVNSNQLSQSKKRKINESEKRIRFYSSARSNKRKKAEQEIVYDKINNSDLLHTLLNTIDSNSHRPSNNYRYPNSVLKFATCLFILAGIYVYEYVRMNLKFLLPSAQTIKKFYSSNPYSEASFRFDECKFYLDSNQCQFIFVSEDCSAIIPKIEYDSILDTFNGFVTPVSNGTPVVNAFRYKSFNELKDALETKSRANLVNIHVVQPIASPNVDVAPSANVLSAYGTDNKINSIDILQRWLMIYQEFYSKNIRVLGYATDGDPKFLRSMRLASNFFVKTQTLCIYNNDLCFTIKIPSHWSYWYFLKPTQLFLFLQDGINLCTKIRNRLLSKRARLQMGLYQVSIEHLHYLIKTTNKIEHNLSKSDLNIRDKQNFSSCQRIANDNVLNLLLLNDQCKGTYNYLLVLNLLIMAYTQSNVSLLDRILYAWIVVFYVRFWRIWLHITKKIRKSLVKKGETPFDEQNFFITPNALISIELNAHYLIYLYLLIAQNILPESAAASAHLYSSQPCENLFRDARSLSGIYSTRINFTIKQFLKRINKLNALTELKQFERTNEYNKIIFPVHHKIKQHTLKTGSSINNKDINFKSDNIEATILQAYEIAQRMAIFVDMSIDLIKNTLFDIQQSSELAKQLLKSNSLTESEILIVEDKDSDEEDDGEIDDEEYDGQEAVDQEVDDEEDSDDETDDGEEADDEEGSVTESNDDIYDYITSEDDTEPTPSFENLRVTSYSGLRLKKTISKTNAHKYFPINTCSKKMFLHKATATWYLQDRQSHLSCDRVQRVQLKSSD